MSNLKTINNITSAINALSVLPNRFTSSQAIQELKKSNLPNFHLQTLYVVGALLRPTRGEYIKTEIYYKTPVKEIYAKFLDLQRAQKTNNKTKTPTNKTKPAPVKKLVVESEAGAIEFLKSLGYKVMKPQVQYAEV